MRIRSKRLTLGALALAVILGVLALLSASGLEEFSLEDRQVTQMSFAANGTVLSGSWVRPNGAGPFPAVVLVHGDGPATRFLDDGLLPFVNALLDAGIAVFAWDKPGTGASIGTSTGDWLDQSMQDRTYEAIAAYQTVLSLPDAAESAVGFLGFSQAGWVVPKASAEVGPAFSVLVGAAVNWRDQASYLTRQRLMAEGASAQEAISLSVAQQRIEDSALQGQVPDPKVFPGLTPKRLAFVHRNYLADSTAALARQRSPLFAIWGAEDLNTDPARNLARFKQALPATTPSKLIVLPSATHSLLDAGRFNFQTPEQWSWMARCAYLWLGQHAYADGALKMIPDWIHQQVADGQAG